MSVSNQTQVTRVPLADVSRLTFEPRSAAASATNQGGGLFACYFANTNVSDHVIIRLDQEINFDWGAREPVAGVGVESFGVAWMGEVEAPATGQFRFVFESDNGGQLFLDNQLIVGARGSLGGPEIEGTAALEAGRRYPLTLLYFHRHGQARARLYWSGPGLPKSIIPRERLFAKSFLREHPAELSRGQGQGLLATYYEHPNFRGHTFSRLDATVDFQWPQPPPAPGITNDKFSARWLGQIKADYSEPYTLVVVTDGGARLWLDDRLLIDQWEQAVVREFKTTLPLEGGRTYNLRLDVRPSGYPATARLLWSSPSIPKAVIPSTHLFPAQTPSAIGVAAEGSTVAAPGVLLRNGSFIAHPVLEATATTAQIPGPWGNHSISIVGVARLVCRPLTAAQAAGLAAARPGVLLAGGDFVEGEFRGLAGGRLKLDTVLFGQKQYDLAKDVLVVVLRESAPAPWRYALRLHDQTLLLVQDIALEAQSLQVQDNLVGTLAIPIAELASLQRSLAAK